MLWFSLLQGKNPLKQFSEGQQIKVRVLAFKEMKGGKKKYEIVFYICLSWCLWIQNSNVFKHISWKFYSIQCIYSSTDNCFVLSCTRWVWYSVQVVSMLSAMLSVWCPRWKLTFWFRQTWKWRHLHVLRTLWAPILAFTGLCVILLLSLMVQACISSLS